SRIMAWWDYGDQINGVANRTSIADGNTWNFEHIALLGKCLLSKEKEAWQCARHLADYVRVWTGRFIGYMSDDMAKMPQLAVPCPFHSLDFRQSYLLAWPYYLPLTPR